LTGTNFTLRDEIKAYWSERAATFDEQPGHEIFSDAERGAWHALILRYLGRGDDQSALDLGCGTGVVSQLMDELGYQVTGLDWAEPMLARARSKAERRGRPIRFLTGDAERTMEPSATYDAVVARHLVWTLVDPAAAFADWRRILKPGGRLLLVDGDFVSPTWVTQLRRLIGSLRLRPGAGEATTMVWTHRNILARVHFSGGARADLVAKMLLHAGFEIESIDTGLRAVHRAQGQRMTLVRRLERSAQHRYAICARRSG
jgi:ubiquinone/menaquinone biosynthesis C-methylase UbiE